MEYVVPNVDAQQFVNDTFRKLKQQHLIRCGEFRFSPISIENVIAAIQKLDTNSSAGVTTIPVKVIKHSANILAPVSVKLFTYFISI